MPFITEELWREFNFSPKLLVTEDWPILDKNRLIFSEAAEDINWKELLLLCNNLVERSATDFDVFLRFSAMNDETLELITN